MERSLFALCALLLNIVLAGPRQWYGAFGLAELFHMPASLLRNAERKLNREHRSLEERRWRGMVVTGIVFSASVLIGWLFGFIARHGFEFIELLLLTIALPVRQTWDRAARIRKSLAIGDIVTARQALAGTAWRHHALLDEYGLARAGIEMLAVGFADKIVAPLFWYLLLGLPGLFASKAIALMQETLTQPGSEPSGFGETAQKAHYWLHFIPARLAAALWLAAALFLPSCTWKDAAKQMTAGAEREPPIILALLSAASVLKLTLGGPVSIYAGDRWIGSGTPKPTAPDLKRALHLFALLSFFLFIVLGVFI